MLDKAAHNADVAQPAADALDTAWARRAAQTGNSAQAARAPQVVQATKKADQAAQAHATSAQSAQRAPETPASGSKSKTEGNPSEGGENPATTGLENVKHTISITTDSLGDTLANPIGGQSISAFHQKAHLSLTPALARFANTDDAFAGDVPLCQTPSSTEWFGGSSQRVPLP